MKCMDQVTPAKSWADSSDDEDIVESRHVSSLLPAAHALSLDIILQRHLPPHIGPNAVVLLSMRAHNTLNVLVTILRGIAERECVDLDNHPVFLVLLQWQLVLREWQKLRVLMNRVSPNVVVGHSNDQLAPWLSAFLADVEAYVATAPVDPPDDKRETEA